MTINKYLLPALVFIFLFGSYGVAQAIGVWSISGKQTIDAGNMASTEDIRGWMTLEQVGLGFGIPQAELYQLLNVPAGTPPQTALKDLEGIIPDFEVTVVRAAVAAHLETAHAPEAANSAVMPQETPAPAKAAESQASPTLTAAPNALGEGSGPTPLPEGELLTGDAIKGRQTLQEIADQAKVPLADLIQALGIDPGTDPDTPVKDLVEAGKISEIQLVRDALTALQERE
jgi:hypothetical protein